MDRTPKTICEAWRMGFEEGEKVGKSKGYTKGFMAGMLAKEDNDGELCVDKCPDWVSLPFSPKDNPEVCVCCKEATND